MLPSYLIRVPLSIGSPAGHSASHSARTPTQLEGYDPALRNLHTKTGRIARHEITVLGHSLTRNARSFLQRHTGRRSWKYSPHGDEGLAEKAAARRDRTAVKDLRSGRRSRRQPQRGVTASFPHTTQCPAVECRPPDDGWPTEKELCRTNLPLPTSATAIAAVAGRRDHRDRPEPGIPPSTSGGRAAAFARRGPQHRRPSNSRA